MSGEIKSEIISWVKTIIFAIISALLISRFVIVNAKIPTASMEDTIMTNDRVLAFRLSYTFSDPKRGDIVVFKYPDNEEKMYVKRIIGMPGESVTIVDGKVYINGAQDPLIDDFVKQNPNGAADNTTSGPYEVPQNAYFMMGDNRTNSEDSRRWVNTYVYKDKILGKVILKYYPRIVRIESVFEE